jgi:hypothetical protein
MEKRCAEFQKILEDHLSPVRWTIMFHLCYHMAKQLGRWGPVRCSWMFNKEDSFGYHKRAIGSHSNPVANIMNMVEISIAVEMMKELLDMQSRLREDERESSTCFVVFLIFCITFPIIPYHSSWLPCIPIIYFNMPYIPWYVLQFTHSIP